MNMNPEVTSRRLLLPTIQEINIPTHLTLRIIQNHRITLLLESAAGVERTDGSNGIVLTATEFTNLQTEIMSLKILPKNIQKILD